VRVVRGDVLGGIQFAAILVLSSFAGMWVDRQIGTEHSVLAHRTLYPANEPRYRSRHASVS
jgi:UPF0716 family protein affecting phage T7 exclusion